MDLVRLDSLERMPWSRLKTQPRIRGIVVRLTQDVRLAAAGAPAHMAGADYVQEYVRTKRAAGASWQVSARVSPESRKQCAPAQSRLSQGSAHEVKAEECPKTRERGVILRAEKRMETEGVALLRKFEDATSGGAVLASGAG